MKRQGWKNEGQRHMMSAKGVSTKETPLVARGKKMTQEEIWTTQEKQDKIWEDIHKYMKKHNIQMISTEDTEWYLFFEQDGTTPYYLWHTDYTEWKSFVKTGVSFTKQDTKFIEDKLKQITEIEAEIEY